MNIIKFNRESKSCTISLSYDDVVAISNGFYKLTEIEKPVNAELQARFHDLHILLRDGCLIKDDHEISLDILQDNKK